VQVPQPNYSNLHIVHVQNPYIGKNLSKLFDNDDKERLKYTDWMKEVILAQVHPGQRALVVCKKTLITNGNVPDWERRDPRWENPATYTDHYGWEIEGRKLCVVHWGTGIGENAWKNADVVLLFGEHIVPKRTSIARTQGLTNSKATEGPLRGMGALNARSPQVEIIHNGGARRWMKQMAGRGSVRNFDEHGVCGHQKLVYTGDYWTLKADLNRLFPDAVLTSEGAVAVTYGEKLAEVLSGLKASESITTTEMAKKVGAPSWKAFGKDVLKRPNTKALMATLNVSYVPGGRGKAGVFVKDSKATKALAELKMPTAAAA
jgi:hypothetical protein